MQMKYTLIGIEFFHYSICDRHFADAKKL